MSTIVEKTATAAPRTIPVVANDGASVTCLRTALWSFPCYAQLCAVRTHHCMTPVLYLRHVWALTRSLYHDGLHLWSLHGLPHCITVLLVHTDHDAEHPVPVVD